MEEAVKRAERERDVLRAEKHVWTVAHSGAQAELANLSAGLEREKQAHEDTRAALKRAKEVAHKVLARWGMSSVVASAHRLNRFS